MPPRSPAASPPLRCSPLPSRSTGPRSRHRSAAPPNLSGLPQRKRMRSTDGWRRSTAHDVCGKRSKTRRGFWPCTPSTYDCILIRSFRTTFQSTHKFRLVVAPYASWISPTHVLAHRSEDVPPYTHPAHEEISRRAAAPADALDRLTRALTDLASFPAFSGFSFTREGKRLVAFARVASDESMVACISDVTVHPGMRGLGLGRLLLHKLTDEIYYNGRIADVGLMCAEDTEPFFQRCGFGPDREGSVSMTFRVATDKVASPDAPRFLAMDTLPAVLKRAARTDAGKRVRKTAWGGRGVGPVAGLRSFWNPRSGYD